ncbi:hypothetical protein [Dysgonomonas sp. ZJ709]|uniref:hypothetical protein n=1 Tax=Dysgonomonas sp. ZJ709 TaxID=2709797 RepID=UPI0013EDF033|nr:hypothetical protein [Dysgonomonas sp. ZJ709]
MRNFILGIVFFLSLQLSAQELSLWNLKYGITQKQAITQIAKERGLTDPVIINDTADSDNILIYYSDCPFAGEDAELVTLSFYKDQFYRAIIMLKPKESRLLTKYDSLVDDISTKYGKPDKKMYSFDYPFEEGDGYELSAIKSGKSNIASRWSIPNRMPTSTVAIVITDQAKIAVLYDYLKISDIVDVKEKNKNLKDL